MQRSESFILGALLSFSGGLQDAYTFNVRDRVFANAQTGNVVLMSQNFMLGNWQKGSDYLFPIISFIGGVFLAGFIEERFKHSKPFHWRQLVIICEFLLLLLVGFLPMEHKRIANMAVSFACAMQVQSFRMIRGKRYASTMCIGNLRSGTACLSRFFENKEKKDIIDAACYFGIILIFALGAGTGGVLSACLGIRTIWISCGILFLAGLYMNNNEESR